MRFYNLVVIIISILSFFSEAGIAQTKYILRDIGYQSSDGLSSNFPHVLHNDTLYFGGSDGSLGTTVWRTDGTPSGTERLVFDNIGFTKQMTILKDSLLFSASKFGRTKLYGAGGSKEEYMEIIGFENDNELMALTTLNDTNLAVFIVLKEDSTEIWRTSGSSSTTERIGVFMESFEKFRTSHFGDFLIFSKDNYTDEDFTPFMTNGTPEGTFYVSDFIASIGDTISVYSAQGDDDVLFVSGTKDIIFFQDTLIYASFQDVQHVVSMGDLRIVTIPFPGNYSIVEFNVNSLEVNGPVYLNILEGTDPIVYKDRFYYFDMDGFVRRYFPSNGTSQKLSSFDIGFNYDGKLIPLGDSIYYSRVWNSEADMRAIHANTGQDKFFDKISTVIMSNHVPVVYRLNNRILYTKSTISEGREWWVYGPETTSNFIGEDYNYSDFVISPNPVINSIRVEFLNFIQSGKLCIYNVEGKLMMSRFLEPGRLYNIDVSVLLSGIYYIQYFSSDFKVMSYFFVKE